MRKTANEGKGQAQGRTRQKKSKLPGIYGGKRDFEKKNSGPKGPDRKPKIAFWVKEEHGIRIGRGYGLKKGKPVPVIPGPQKCRRGPFRCDNTTDGSEKGK